MAKREFVQLAHKFDAHKSSIGGWYLSEKMDGHRCFWDGGVSRGFRKSLVPWANLEKDERFIKEQFATGLWSRYGNVIHAPDWFLDQLPRCPLDGELWSRSMSRQEISSIIKSLTSQDWSMIGYNVFDIPPYETIFTNGLIENVNFKKTIDNYSCMAFVSGDRGLEWWDYYPSSTLRYESAYKILDSVINGVPGTKAKPFASQVAVRVPQTQLPYPQNLAVTIIEKMCDAVVRKGGEGVMVRDPNATYKCERSRSILKVKPCDDAEGTVIGYISGKETDKGSKLLGMMGAMVLSLDSGARMELSGFTEAERVLEHIRTNDECEEAITSWQIAQAGGFYQQGQQQPCTKQALDEQVLRWATRNPGTECPDFIQAKAFPRGTRVSFKYRGLSDGGIPQEARYWRKDEQL